VRIEFRESFAKDLKGIKDKGLLKRAKEIIESIEKVDSLADVANLKKWRELFSFESRGLSGRHCS
jgi:hypothetical protein